jgi:hypothetical protein
MKLIFFNENPFKSKANLGTFSWYVWKVLGYNEGDLDVFKPKVWELLNFEYFL